MSLGIPIELVRFLIMNFCVNETFSLTYKSSYIYTARLLTSKSLRIVAVHLPCLGP